LHPDLEALLALQEKDGAVAAAQLALDALKPEEDALDAELGAHRKALEDAQRGVAGAEARRSEMEQRIASYKQLQERRRQQLDFVRGAKEASTLMAEIDMARGVLVKEEADFMRSGDAIVEAEKKVKDAAKQHEAVVAAQAEARAALAQKREGLLAELDGAKTERAAAAHAVQPALLGRYERIRRGRSPQVIYPVKSDACGHCMTAVPLQRRVRIQQGESIESCEVCGVMLYAEA
jgi:predicted  nucleic acid-binding Zn-ribbon protein